MVRKKWITYKEAVEMFSVSESTLRRLVKQGVIQAGPPNKIGKKGVRLNLESIERYFLLGVRKRGRPRKHAAVIYPSPL